jgi:hypothetical protein
MMLMGKLLSSGIAEHIHDATGAFLLLSLSLMYMGVWGAEPRHGKCSRQIASTA